MHLPTRQTFGSYTSGLLRNQSSCERSLTLLSYGFMIGFGASIAYLGSIITMGQYFEKRRTLAVALVIAGAGGYVQIV